MESKQKQQQTEQQDSYLGADITRGLRASLDARTSGTEAAAMPAAKEKHEISLREAAQLSRYLRARSREICKDNECPRGGDHNCESYAYIRHDGRLLDVCASDYFQGESKPYAAVSLPWTGNAHELRDEIEEQTFEQLEQEAASS